MSNSSQGRRDITIILAIVIGLLLGFFIKRVRVGLLIGLFLGIAAGGLFSGRRPKN